MELSILDEKNLRIEAATLGATIALGRLGLIKDEISQREAFRMFGEGRVRSWANQRLLRKIKVGGKNSKCTYSRVELETIRDLADAGRIK